MNPTKRTLHVLLALILIFGVFTQVSSAQTEEFTVNGLKVIVKNNPANSIVSAQLYLRGGAMNLAEETQGIEPLLFNSALKGSKNYPKDKLNGLLDRTGAVINSNSNRDFTAITLRCLVGDLDALWGAYADVVMNPTLDEAEVNLVRGNQLSGIKQRNDNPDGYLNETANEVFYGNHQYRLNPAGTETAVKAITIDQLKKHLADNLVTSKLVLVVVGNITKADIQSKVTATFGKLPKGNYTPQRPPAMSHSSSKLTVKERQLPTNYIIGFCNAPRIGDKEYYAATVAMNILRNRVFEEVRTKRNLSYAPSAYLEGQLGVNRAAIYVTAVQPDTTIKVFFAELKKMQNEPVSAKDLRDRVSLFLTSYYLQNETK
ncbi:MAG: insulinase family protein, partial [Ignavibacteriae bacterium]|nr:insulinase family protein [Ignavibacteriota bacterium]